MNNFGQRIKLLRKKNDLTQEKLAELLGITYKSVSKWECGLTTPDLALIVPLAKILGITTDELLGATEADKRLEELERLYDEAFRTNFPEDTLAVAQIAVKEYPADMKWLNRMAWDSWSLAISTMENGEAFEAERERIIKMFERVIANTDDDNEKAHAICGITGCLCGKGCKAEAMQYVELYPDTKIDPREKQRLTAACLDGEERIKHKQQYLMNYFNDLVHAILWNDSGSDEDVSAAAEGVIKAMIPDGNYFEFHHPMCNLNLRKARIAMKRGDHDLAVECLRSSAYHARAYDEFTIHSRREYCLTAPLFDRIVFDSRKEAKCPGTVLGDLKENCKTKIFAPLFEREDFKAILEMQ